MKQLIQTLQTKNLIFKKLEKLDNKDFKIRNKIDIYKSIDIKNNYWIIFDVKQTSRVLQKHIQIYQTLVTKIETQLDINFKKRALLINAPLCSKAEGLLKEYKWSLFI